MAELKSAYELAMEKLRAQGASEEATLSAQQKERIAELRREYQAKLAEREIMKGNRVARLPERTRPEELAERRREIEDEYGEERRALEEELEAKIREVREGR